MTSATESLKPDPPVMTRIDVSADEWALIRSRAAIERKTTQRWLAEAALSYLARSTDGATA